MCKYIVWVIKIHIWLLWDYFRWIKPYAKHPQRYPLELRAQKCQTLTKRILKSFKVDLEIINEPKLNINQTYYFVANHVSMLDPVVTMAIMQVPATYISKAEVEKIPFIGKVMKILDGVFIERGNLKQEIKALQATRKSLAAKEISWIVFPEGTRNPDYFGTLNQYKSGAFKAALQTDTPIIPCVIWGTQVVMHKKTRAKRYKVLIEFLDPLAKGHEAMKNTHTIAEHIQRESEVIVKKLRDVYPSKVKLNRFGQNLINRS